MNKLSLLFSVLLLTSSLSFAQGNEASQVFQKLPDEEAEFMFAKKSFSDGFYSLAQDSLEGFLKNYPATGHLYEAHLLLGRSLYYQNDLERAYYEFGVVLDAPNTSGFEDGALYWMGNIYFRERNYEKALESYQKILDGYPASKYYGYAIYSKAWVYYKLGFLEDAIIAFEEVVSKYNFDKIGMDSLFKIGECEYLLGRYKDAEKSINDFIDKYPLSNKTAESYYFLGDIGLRRGEYKNSINYFNKALSMAPGVKWRIFALYRSAQSYSCAGDYDESSKRFSECAKISKNVFLKGNSLLGLARNYEKNRMSQDAIKICDDIIAKFPKSDASIEAFYIKAKILNAQKKPKEALAVCLLCMDKFTSPMKMGKIHYQMGEAYIQDGKAMDALKQFEAAVGTLKDEGMIASALCKAGDIYFASGNLAKAMENYDAVLESYPDNPPADYAQFGIGNIFLTEKKFDQAILSFQSALAHFPDSDLKDKMLLKLAFSYFAKGDFVRAAEEFKKIPGIEAKFYIANSLYNMDRYEESLELFREIAKGPSEKPVTEYAQYQIGWCYYRMNKDIDAADSFDVFFKRYPGSALKQDALNQSVFILSNAAKNFEKWKMPEDAARLYKRLGELKSVN